MDVSQFWRRYCCMRRDTFSSSTDSSNTPRILCEFLVSVCPEEYSHITKAGNDAVGTHPEIRDYLEEVQATIMSPDLVLQSTRDARSRVCYRLRVGRGEFTGKHLVVIVKYAQ